MLLEDALDRPEKPTETPPQPASVLAEPKSLPILPPAPIVLGFQRDPDRFNVVLRQALIDVGFDRLGTNGATQRVIQIEKLRPVYYTSPTRQSQPNKANNTSFSRCIKALIERGVACREGDLIWLATPPVASISDDPPPPPTRKQGQAPNYERLYRVLKHTLSQHGAVDAKGRRGVDEKKVREAFVEARIRENETNNKEAHKAAWNVSIGRLLTDGVIERDGSIVRMLTPP